MNRPTVSMSASASSKNLPCTTGQQNHDKVMGHNGPAYWPVQIIIHDSRVFLAVA